MLARGLPPRGGDRRDSSAPSGPAGDSSRGWRVNISAADTAAARKVASTRVRPSFHRHEQIPLVNTAGDNLSSLSARRFSIRFSRDVLQLDGFDSASHSMATNARHTVAAQR